MVKVNTDNRMQLALFHGTDAVIEDANLMRTKEQTDTVTGALKSMQIDVMPRKDLAKALDLSPKKDKEELEGYERDLSDGLKAKMGAEVAGILQSPNWTGVRIKATKNKAGVVTKTLVFKSVSRKKQVTLEQIAEAYGFTVEEAQAMIDRQIAEIEAKEKATHNVDAKVEQK